MSRPKILHVGGVLYWTIETADPDTMQPKDADSTPTVAVRKNGASTGDSVTITKRSATTGIYDCSYNPAGEVEGDKFTIEESATVTGTTTSSATYRNPWNFVVVAIERGTDGANTTTPPTASANATQVRTELSTELARIDATVSSRSTLTATQVWEHATRSLTTFGTLVSDIWSNASRTLTAISDSSGVTTLLSRILGTLAAGTHQPQTGDAFAKWGDESGASIAADIANIEGGGSGLTGDYTLTVTVTDADTEEAIEAATVTLFRTGERGVEETDDEGEATFGLNAATWSWVVRAAGYQSATGTEPVSGNGTLDVELTAIVEPVLDNPDHASLRVKCLDEANQPEPGAVVYIQIVGIPAGSTGLSFDGISQEATAGSDGIATLTIVKLAKYQIRRGDSKQWKPFTATSDNSQTITSFIGVDPA